MANLPDKFEARCLICKHGKKSVIERMVVSGWSFSDIEREFEDTDEPAPRRSVSGHAKLHMDYEQQAIRKIIEKRAEEQGLNVDTTTERLLQGQAYLDIILQKGFEAIIDNNIAPEPKDVFKAIELKDKFEKDSIPWTIEKIDRQFRALTQAVKELVPSHLMPDIISRSREIYENGNENITDAVIVEDSESSDRGRTLEVGEPGEVHSDGTQPRVPESLDG